LSRAYEDAIFNSQQTYHGFSHKEQYYHFNGRSAFNGAPVTEKTFQCFAKNILCMLDKDKSSEGLIEKLCLRFDNTSNIWDLRNTAYCISQLNLSDKALRMLLHHYEHIRPRMYDGEISNCFKVLLNKVTSLIKRS
jgi:hypothetical protein